jgi:hypothetical protein
MNMRSKLGILVICAGLSATASCTPWPDEGGGGFAERRPSQSPELLGLAHRLQNSIERGARHSYAAQTAEAELQLTRAQRTWSAGFVEDYIKDYQVLDVLVQDVEAHIGVSSRYQKKRGRGSELSE